VTGEVQRCFSSTMGESHCNNCYPSSKCGNLMLNCFECHVYISSHCMRQEKFIQYFPGKSVPYGLRNTVYIR
jgi:hypothetical protein